SRLRGMPRHTPRDAKALSQRVHTHFLLAKLYSITDQLAKWRAVVGRPLRFHLTRENIENVSVGSSRRPKPRPAK
ncbi:MAG TPA: hypothetical protein VE957_22530, partial [Terriglobales bacterium]|nr:hypothetical protein [Terriglobales bacterium]